MPEGHTLHRLARDLNETFAGGTVRSSSPQGRFTGAALLDCQELEGAQAVGKHLFVDFGADRLVHVHLGLYGKFLIAPAPPPPPVGAVRWRLSAPSAYADLRGPTTCELVSDAELAQVEARLGPDPLRADADPDRAWRRIRASRTPVAALLMDQTVLAGVGNVYRAEVLFRHRLDPMMEGRLLRKPEWTAIWADLRQLMAQGVESNRIDTVRPEHEPEAMGRPPRQDDHGGEVYAYRRDGQACHVCGSTIRSRQLAARNLFWCPRCQRRTRRRSRSGAQSGQ